MTRHNKGRGWSVREMFFALTNVIALSMAIQASAASPNADFSCKDIEISLDQSGMAQLDASQVIKGDKDNTFDHYQVLVQGTWSNWITCAQAWGSISYTATDINTGKWCTGWVKVKDETPPEFLNCTTVVVSCTTDLKAVPAPDVIDNCSERKHLEVKHKDKKRKVECEESEDTSLIVYRTWYATDKYGNVGTCVQRIAVVTAPLSAVEFPPDVVIDCPETNFDPDITGHPTIEGSPFDHLCGLLVKYEDKVLETCGGTFVIWRHWVVTNCCTFKTRDHFQKISSIDDVPPELICPEDITVGTNKGVPYARVIIPEPKEVSDNCQGPVDLKVLIDDSLELEPGDPLFLMKGTYKLTYSATDECSNVSTCTSHISVVDKEKPEFLKCEDLVLDVTSEDPVVISVEDLENVMAVDNCGDVDLNIRKNRDLCIDDENDIVYDDTVIVCCEDIGQGILIVVEAVDMAGNRTTCVFTPIIVDLEPPMIVCQDTIELTCDSDLSQVGLPEVIDNCGGAAAITCEVIDSTVDECGVGTIVKRYIATDPGGQSDSCIQTIILTNPNKFGPDNFICPEDVDIMGCTLGDLEAVPTLEFTGLSLLNCFEIDTIFTQEITSDTAFCIVINRTWQIFDRCQPDSMWICTQQIRIDDSEPPVLSGPPSIITAFATFDSCIVRVSIPTVVAADCDTAVDITNSFGGGPTLDMEFPVGETTVEYEGVDDCGNRDTLVVLVRVLDTIPPEIDCPEDTTITCGDPIPLQSPASSDNCAIELLSSSVSRMLDECGNGTITRTYTVTDESGNEATCQQTITVSSEGLFTEANIIWPPSPVNIDTCAIPDSLEVPGVQLDTTDSPCINIFVTFEDSVGTSDDFCIIIFRRHIVIDSCVFNPITGEGRYDSVQVINIDDQDPPVLTGPGDLTVFVDPADCLADVDFTVQVTDCDPNVMITNDKTAGGANYQASLPPGEDTVNFTATDFCGNESTLQVVITVKDTVPPVFEEVDDIFVACGESFERVTPNVSDECTEVDTVIVDSVRIEGVCERDTIVYTFTALDICGSEATTSYRVIFTPGVPFSCEFVTLPRPVINLTECDASTNPDSIENSRPVINLPDTLCYGIVTSFVDSVSVDTAVGVCDIQIIRWWTIADTCGGDTCTISQVINVTDEDPPVLSLPADTCVYALPTDSLGTFIDFPDITAEDCDPNPSIDNNYNNGGAVLDDFFGLGDTEVIFTARDACGNVDMDTLIVTVKDTSAPLFVCRKEPIQIPDGNPPSLTIFPDRFVENVFDNFTPLDEIRYSFSSQVMDTSRTFGCDSIGVVFLEIFVWDNQNNFDSCSGFLGLIDTVGVCPDSTIGAASVYGQIVTETGTPIVDVAIPHPDGVIRTDRDGSYALEHVFLGDDFTLRPEKTEFPLNGVSTIDIVEIHKHLLGFEGLSTPYKILAADADKSGSVSASDIITVRRLILGLDDHFPDLASWRFVDRSFEFADPRDPFLGTAPVREIPVSGLGVHSGFDFVGYKVGDVNESADPYRFDSPQVRFDPDPLQLTYEIEPAGNDTYWVHFKSGELVSLRAFQFTLEYDPHQQVFVAADGKGLPDFSDANIGEFPDFGALTFSWHSLADFSIGVDGPVFSLLFENIAGTAPEFRITDGITADEAYTISGVSRNIVLGNGLDSDEGLYRLYQNTPNPFTDKTEIVFEIPQSQNVSIKVIDVSGRVLKDIRRQYSAGTHRVEIRSVELGSQGVLFYSMETEAFQEVKRMILLEH